MQQHVFHQEWVSVMQTDVQGVFKDRDATGYAINSSTTRYSQRVVA